jgi:hypothetical protein
MLALPCGNVHLLSMFPTPSSRLVSALGLDAFPVRAGATSGVWPLQVALGCAVPLTGRPVEHDGSLPKLHSWVLTG